MLRQSCPIVSITTVTNVTYRAVQKRKLKKARLLNEQLVAEEAATRDRRFHNDKAAMAHQDRANRQAEDVGLHDDERYDDELARHRLNLAGEGPVSTQAHEVLPPYAKHGEAVAPAPAYETSAVPAATSGSCRPRNGHRRLTEEEKRQKKKKEAAMYSLRSGTLWQFIGVNMAR